MTGHAAFRPATATSAPNSSASGSFATPLAELTQVRGFLASIVESSDDAIVGKSTDGTVFSWNRGAERLYGFQANEMLGRPISRIVPRERMTEWRDVMERLQRGERVEHLETVRVRKDGRRVDVSLSMSPVLGADDEILGVAAIARDITERRARHDAETDALARLRAVFETAVDGIVTIDGYGTIETVNPAAQRIFGYGSDELIGKNVRMLMPEPYRSEHDGYLTTFRNGGVPKVIGTGREVRGLRRDGTEFPMELAVSETVLPERTVFTGIIRDISRRRRAEQALRESEARFRSMAEGAPVLIWMSGTNKACTWFNKRWLDFTGRTLEQELGDGWLDAVHEADVQKCRDDYTRAFDARTPFELEYRLRRRDGEYRWVRDVGVPIRQEGGAFAGYIGSCVDITDQRAGEDALRDRVVQRTRELTNANRELRHEVEERLWVESVLATENRILELIATGLDHETLLAAVCTEMEELLPGCRCAIQVRSIGHTNTRHATTVGTERCHGIEVFGEVARDGVFPSDLAEKNVETGAIRPTPPHLQAKRLGAQLLRPVLVGGGVSVGALGLYFRCDVTPPASAETVATMATRLTAIIVERARAEVAGREQLAQLAHVSRLATMGEMASELAHELNQPLCAIVNFTEACIELLERDSAEPAALQTAMTEVAGQAERAGAVIRRLRDFVKRREPERAAVDIRQIVREVIAFTRPDLRHSGVRVRLKLPKRLPRVFADSIQIQQVLVNLVRNACDAMRDHAGSHSALTIRAIRIKEMVEVRVADNGPGLSEDRAERIFEPFYTTKPDGMGVGLSITRTILDAHDGRIWFTSNLLGGLTFHFTLPLAGRGRRG